MSTSSLLGVVSASYNIGPAWALFGGVGVVLGFIVCMYVLAPKFREMEVNTLPEYFEKVFGVRTKRTSALIIAVVMFLYLVAQIKGAAHVAEYMLNIPYTTAVLVTGGVLILYIALGGMLAATYTSYIQVFVLYFGIIAITYGLFKNIGWMEATTVLSELNPVYFTSAGGAGIGFGISFGLLMFMSILCAPHVLSRFFAAKSEKVAVKTAAIASIFTGVFYVFMVFPPIVAIITAPNLTDPDTAYLAAAEAIFANNPIILGLILAGVLSAAMSSADVMLLNASSAIVYDLGEKYFDAPHKRKKIPYYLRLITVIIGIAVILVTITSPGLILQIMILALSMFIGAFLAPVLLGIWVKKRSDIAGVAAMISGIVVTVLTHPATPFFQFSQETYAGIAGMITSFLAFFIVNKIVISDNMNKEIEFAEQKAE